MDTIYYGGPILTMESENDSPEAVLVSKGIIKKVGTLKETMDAAGSNVRKYNLDGRCLMPSFIDPHGHIVMNGQMALFADLSECSNFDDIVNVMKKFIADNKVNSKQVAVGFGYDHNFLDEHAHPGKDVLDKVDKNIPIMILHVSGHMGCVNSALLELAGIDENTENPQGGVIGRVEGSNEPNGYLEEAATMAAQAVLGKRIKPDLGKMIRGMQQVYIENGVTTVQEGAGNAGSMKLLKRASMLGKLKVDVVVYPLISEGGEKLIAGNKKMLNKYRKHVKIGGYKMILDGSPQGRSAWMSEPYLGGEEGYCAYPWITDEEADKYALTAVNSNLQILAHCNGDAASEQFLNAYEKALAESDNPNKDNLRPVMIHCQTVRNDQLDRMAAVNMIPSIFVGHVFYWGDIHKKNFGRERGNHISPARDALDRGLVINFHQDAPVTKPNMLHSVWCAVNRLSREGDVIGEDQKIGVYDALKAVTINAAYEYFEEDEKGSIKEGKRADLVVLDKNPLDTDILEIKDIKVMETIKDGKCIFSRRK